MRFSRSITLLAGLMAPLCLGIGLERGPLVGMAHAQAREGQERSQRGIGSYSDRARSRLESLDRRIGRSGGDILPHHGDYVIEITGFSTARFVRAKGTLTIDLIDDCSDWTLQEKLDVVLYDQEKASYRSNLLYRGTEKASADRFIFAYSRDHLGERQDFIGDARPVEGGAVASFIEPKIPDLFLPGDVVYPISHFRQVVAAARRQRESFESVVFDGANPFAYHAVTTISPPLRSNDSNPRVADARAMLDRSGSDRLPNGRTWPVTTEYALLDDPYAAPVLVREFLLHESGVMISLHLDYGDVQMDARLAHLDIVPPTDCSATARR